MTTRPRAPRIKPKAGYHHGDLHRQLVAAARRLIDKDGAGGFKLADAAALAGVSPAAPYRHFRDRQALLTAVADDGFERMSVQAEEAVSAHAEGSIEAVCAVGEAYIAFARTNQNVFRLMFSPGHGKGHDDCAPSEAGVSAYNVLIRQVSSYLDMAPDSPPVLGTALSLWMYVHGFASLLIDDQLGVGRLEIDIPTMLRANGLRMLDAFVR